MPDVCIVYNVNSLRNCRKFLQKNCNQIKTLGRIIEKKCFPYFPKELWKKNSVEKNLFLYILVYTQKLIGWRKRIAAYVGHVLLCALVLPLLPLLLNRAGNRSTFFQREISRILIFT